MASKPAGTPQKVTINGITYDVTADSDPTLASKFANEMTPTTGNQIKKIVKQSPNMEGLTLAATKAELDELEKVAGLIEDVPMSMTYAGGEVVRADGGINLDTYSAQNATVDVMLMPAGVEGWTSFN
jgi:hypothetical protein